MRSIAVTVAAVALLAAEIARGQDLNSTIVGCSTFGCPPVPGTTSVKCHVVDKMFTALGLARIPVPSAALAGLSWTFGLFVTENDSRDKRIFDKSFYLGSPPGVNLTNTGACAVFFNEVSSRVVFDDPYLQEAEGTCEEAMSTDCVNALINRAIAVNVSGLSTSDACRKIQTSFQEGVDSACASFATGSRWTGLTVERRCSLLATFTWKRC